MLLTNKIGSYESKNQDAKFKKNNINFGSWRSIRPIQRSQIVDNLLNLERTAAIEKLESSVEKLPSLEKEAAPVMKKINNFFTGILNNLKKSPDKNTKDAICDSFEMAENDINRMYVDNDLRKMFISFETNSKYDNFFDSLTKGLYEDIPDPVIEKIEKEVSPSETAGKLKNKTSKTRDKSLSPSKLTEEDGEEIENSFKNGPKRNFGKRFSVFSKSKDNTAPKFSDAEGQLVEKPAKTTSFELQDEEIFLSKREKKRLQIQEDVKARQEKIDENDNLIKELKKELEGKQEELADTKRLLKHTQREKELNAKSSEFINASKRRRLKEGRIRRIIAKFLNKEQPKEVIFKTEKIDISRQVVKKDGTINKRELRKVFQNGSKVEVHDKEATIQLPPEQLKEIQKQRRALKNLNAKYPDLQIINKRIERLKAALAPETFNSKELQMLERETHISAEKFKSTEDYIKNNIKKLTDANKQIEKSIVIKSKSGDIISYKEKITELNRRQPVKKEASTDKEYRTALKNWKNKLAELKNNQLKAEEFFKNEKLIKELEERLSHLQKSGTQRQDITIKQSVLLEQRTKIEEFLNKEFKIKRGRGRKTLVKTGREILEEKLQLAEQLKQELIESEKKNWEIGSKLGKLLEAKSNAQDKIQNLTTKIKEVDTQGNKLKRTQMLQEKWLNEQSEEF